MSVDIDLRILLTTNMAEHFLRSSSRNNNFRWEPAIRRADLRAWIESLATPRTWFTNCEAPARKLIEFRNTKRIEVWFSNEFNPHFAWEIVSFFFPSPSPPPLQLQCSCLYPVRSLQPKVRSLHSEVRSLHQISYFATNISYFAPCCITYRWSLKSVGDDESWDDSSTSYSLCPSD